MTRRPTYLLFRSEIVDDVEQLGNLLRGFTLDQVGDSLAPDIATQHHQEIKRIGIREALAYTKGLISR